MNIMANTSLKVSLQTHLDAGLPKLDSQALSPVGGGDIKIFHINGLPFPSRISVKVEYVSYENGGIFEGFNNVTFVESPLPETVFLQDFSIDFRAMWHFFIVSQFLETKLYNCNMVKAANDHFT